jgi:hypothetical protein
MRRQIIVKRSDDWELRQDGKRAIIVRDLQSRSICRISSTRNCQLALLVVLPSPLRVAREDIHVFSGNKLGGVSDRGSHLLGCQIIFFADGFHGFPGRQMPQDSSNKHACIGDDWLAMDDGRVL